MEPITDDNLITIDEFVITIPSGYLNNVEQYINNNLPYQIDYRTTIRHPGILNYHRISPIQVLPSKEVQFKIRAEFYK